MAAESALDPTLAQEEEDEVLEDDEESDTYEVDCEEEGEDVDYEAEEAEEEAEEGLGEGEPKNMTALLLGKPNGTTAPEVYDEDEDDEEYQDDAEGILDDNHTDLSSSVAGSKRGVDELASREDASDEDEDDEAEVVTKKARV